jgi:hypothetical protein
MIKIKILTMPKTDMDVEELDHFYVAGENCKMEQSHWKTRFSL